MIRNMKIRNERMKLYLLSVVMYITIIVYSVVLVYAGRALETSGILTTEIGSYVNDIIWVGGGLLMYAIWWASVCYMVRSVKKVWEWKNEQEIK